MAKQKRKRKEATLSTIVKLSSTRLNAQSKPITRPPRVRRRTRHRPARQCCITQSEEQVSKYCVLGSGLSPEELQNLEQSWGMKVGSLKLVTPANMIYLCNDFGQAHLEDHWLLIPPINTLAMIYESYKDLDPGDMNRWHETLLPGFFEPEPLEYVFVPLTSRGRDLLTSVAPLKDDPSFLNELPLPSNHPSEGPTVMASFHPFFAIAHAIQLRRTSALPPQHDKWLYLLEIEWRRRYKSSIPLSPLQPPKTKKRKRRPDSEDDISSPIRKRTNLSWEEQSRILNAQLEPAIPRWRANIGSGSQADQTDGGFVPEDLVAYRNEPSRDPPTWSEWRPDWSSANQAGKSEPLDTRKFSSNDWAFYRSQALLPGSVDFYFNADPMPKDGVEASEHVTFRQSPTPSTDQSKW